MTEELDTSLQSLLLVPLSFSRKPQAISLRTSSLPLTSSQVISFWPRLDLRPTVNPMQYPHLPRGCSRSQGSSSRCPFLCSLKSLKFPTKMSFKYSLHNLALCTERSLASTLLDLAQHSFFGGSLPRQSPCQGQILSNSAQRGGPTLPGEPFRKQNVLLTQRDDNPTVLLHDIFSIKVCLRGIQAPPLLLGEAQGHILDGYQSLKQAQRLSVSSCSDGKYDLTTKG